MWVFIVVMMMHTLWDTVGERTLSIIQKLKGKE